MPVRLATALLEQNRPADAVRFVQDHGRRRTEGREAEGREGDVASPIAFLTLPAGMKLLAVALDHEPSVHEQINPADAGKVRLRLDRAPERARHEPKDALGPGFRSAVD